MAVSGMAARITTRCQRLEESFGSRRFPRTLEETDALLRYCGGKVGTLRVFGSMRFELTAGKRRHG